MPKLKTNRAAARRFKFTKNGKIKRKKAFKSHILTKMTTKRKRNLRHTGYIHKSDEREVKALLPWGK